MLLSWFPGDLNVVQLKDPGMSGNFEVTIDDDLVHSKKTKGHGFLNLASDPNHLDGVKKFIQGKIDAA